MKAFPRQITFNNGISQGTWIDDGMDLRDYFAANAIIHGAFSSSTNKYDETVAKRAYEIADAMMKAREEKK